MFVAGDLQGSAGIRRFTEPEDLPTEQLEHEITELAAHLNAGCCRWLELVAEFDRRGVWAGWGCRSAAEWVAWQCALNTRSAREHVRVARRLEELPRIHDQFACGRLSYSKVRALTRVADPDTEEDLIELARHATASQLERIVRGLRHVTTAEAEDQQINRYLVTRWEEDGSLSIRGRLAPEDGAAFLAGLDAAHDRLREEREWERDRAERGSAEPRSHSGSAEPQLAPETARRLACDSALIPIIERRGGALSVGRKTRAVPPAIRRAVEARDGHCRYPGCERRRFLDAHHIIHWARGGETDKGNLILLCRHHHRFVHEGGVQVSGSADSRVRFRLRDGTTLQSSSPALRGEVELLRRANLSASRVIDPETCLSGTGERMDGHWVVGVYADRLHGRDPPGGS